MKVELQISADIDEPYIVIHTSKITPEINQLMELFQSSGNVITVTDNDQLIVLEPSEIYMLRMEDERLNVYCQQKKYVSGKRLYEMERLLGNGFMRISKSAILNTNQVYAINRNLAASSVIEFRHTHKQVYVSRNYYKPLKNKLEEKRIHANNSKSAGTYTQQ